MVRSKKIQKSKISLKQINVFAGGLSLLILVLYLMTINAINAQGYRIKELDGKISGLREENKSLSLGASEAESMERVVEEVQKIGMVEAGRVHFINGGETAVARK